MEEIYIVGASGLGKEVAWLIEKDNLYKIKGFVDDNPNVMDQEINGYRVLGGVESLLEINDRINVVIAIGKPKIRKIITEKLADKDNISFPNIIAKSVIISKFVEMGKGNIICDGNIITTNIEIGDFNHIDRGCMIGHDSMIYSYSTLYPASTVSGNVTVGNGVELGTGSKVIQGITITDNVILGAGAIVVRDITEQGTYVGVPANRLEKTNP